MSKLYVYVLKNLDTPPKYYTGLTSNVARRLVEHNSDGPHRTCRYRPWSLDVVIEFADERRAAAFERSLPPRLTFASFSSFPSFLNSPRASSLRAPRHGLPRRSVSRRRALSFDSAVAWLAR